MKKQLNLFNTKIFRLIILPTLDATARESASMHGCDRVVYWYRIMQHRNAAWYGRQTSHGSNAGISVEPYKRCCATTNACQSLHGNEQQQRKHKTELGTVYILYM